VIQRRVMAGIAIAASALVLSACGFQSPAVTNHERTSDQGSNFSVGPVQVRNVYVTTLQTSETATTSYVVATFVNNSQTPAELTGITASQGQVTLAGPGVDSVSGALTIPPRGVPLRIDQPLSTPGGATATLAAATAPGAGTYVPMQFTFGSLGTSSTAQVPVVPPTETTAVSSPVPVDVATPPPAEGQETNGSN
jgi:hypothetical protein